MGLIEINITDKIAYWRLNSPKSRNAISKILLEEIYKSALELTNVPLKSMPRVLILEGIPGVAFSSGADLKERKSMTEDEVWEYLNLFRETLRLLENLPIPTLAAISGVALGGGLEIALALDFRLIREDARIGLPEVKLGIIPGAGGTQRLSRLISLNKAKEWIFSGRTFQGKEAVDYGVANYCYSIEDFSKNLQKFALEFIDSAPISISAAKSAIQKAHSFDFEKGLDIERFYYKTTIETKDRQEALLAFQEKRKPIFIGE